MPEKAAAGLRQLGVEVAGKTLAELLDAPLPAGHVDAVRDLLDAKDAGGLAALSGCLHNVEAQGARSKGHEGEGPR